MQSSEGLTIEQEEKAKRAPAQKGFSFSAATWAQVFLENEFLKGMKMETNLREIECANSK